MKFNPFIGVFSVLGLIYCGQAGAQSIRNVDCDDAPEAQFLVQRARQIGDAIYPQIVSLLADGRAHPPRRLDIVFRRHLSGQNSGYASRKAVFLNADFLADHPETLDFLLAHEMAHVAQDYPNLPPRHSWQWFPDRLEFFLTHFRHYPSAPPSYWEEGIADCVCQRLGYSNQWDCDECAEEFPKYTAGYGCAAAFLLYIDKTSGDDFTKDLNSALRQGAYSNEIFLTLTGNSLDEWWKRFRQTEGFRPIAAQLNGLHEELGYVAGKPPMNLSHKLEDYCQSHPDAGQFFNRFSFHGVIPPQALLRMVEFYLAFRQRPEGERVLREIEASVDDLHQALAFTNHMPPADLPARLRVYLDSHHDIQQWCDAHGWLENPGAPIQREIEDFYIARIFPGGAISISADESLARFKRQGRLPGWGKHEHGTAALFQPLPSVAKSFPAYRRFDCRKNGSRFTYHYELIEPSVGADWKLKRAWKTDARGKSSDLVQN